MNDINLKSVEAGTTMTKLDLIANVALRPLLDTAGIAQVAVLDSLGSPLKGVDAAYIVIPGSSDAGYLTLCPTDELESAFTRLSSS